MQLQATSSTIAFQPPVRLDQRLYSIILGMAGQHGLPMTVLVLPAQTSRTCHLMAVGLHHWCLASLSQ